MREVAHLPKQKRGEGIAAARNGGTVGACGRESERSRGVRRIENVQRFAPYVGSELDGVAAAHERERVEKLGDGSGEPGVGGGGGTDLLEARDREYRQYGGEGVLRQARDGDIRRFAASVDRGRAASSPRGTG